MFGAVAPKQRPAKKVTAIGGPPTAVDHAALLERGGRVMALTGGQYSLWDVIVALLDRVGEPAEVVFAFWTAGRLQLDAIAQLRDEGRISRLRLVMDHSFPARLPDYADTAREIYGPDCFRLLPMHAKFAIITAGKWRIVLRCSANINRNTRVECWEVDDDAELHDWWLAQVDALWADASPLEHDAMQVQRQSRVGFRVAERAAKAEAMPDTAMEERLEYLRHLYRPMGD